MRRETGPGGNEPPVGSSTRETFIIKLCEKAVRLSHNMKYVCSDKNNELMSLWLSQPPSSYNHSRILVRVRRK